MTTTVPFPRTMVRQPSWLWRSQGRRGGMGLMQQLNMVLPGSALVMMACGIFVLPMILEWKLIRHVMVPMMFYWYVCLVAMTWAMIAVNVWAVQTVIRLVRKAR
jgi:hypothetical protein